MDSACEIDHRFCPGVIRNVSPSRKFHAPLLRKSSVSRTAVRHRMWRACPLSMLRTFGVWIRFHRDACIRGLVTCRGRAARPIQAPWAQHPPRDHSTTSSWRSSRCALPARARAVSSCTRRLPAPTVLKPLTVASCACAGVDVLEADCMRCGGRYIFSLMRRPAIFIKGARVCVQVVVSRGIMYFFSV